jgi:cytoskeletal protein RodZ
MAMKKSISSPGNKLLRARQKKRLTRADVAARLDIEKTDVKYLDQWEIAKLSHINNLRNLVRQYALLVGLSPAELEGYVVPEKTRNHKDKKLIILSKTSLTLTALTTILLAVGFIIWRTVIATTEPELSLNSPTNGQQITVPTIVVEGITSERAQVFVNGILAPVDLSGHFQNEVILSSGANAIEVIAINSFGRETKLTRTVFFNQLD